MAAWEQVRELLLLASSETSATFCLLIWFSLRRRFSPDFFLVFHSQLDDRIISLRLIIQNRGRKVLAVDRLTARPPWTILGHEDRLANLGSVGRAQAVHDIGAWKAIASGERQELTLFLCHPSGGLAGARRVSVRLRSGARVGWRRRKKLTAILPPSRWRDRPAS